MGNWISLSYRTNFGSMFLYDSSPRFASQHYGLLSLSIIIVLCVVLRGHHILQIFNEHSSNISIGCVHTLHA